MLGTAANGSGARCGDGRGAGSNLSAVFWQRLKRTVRDSDGKERDAETAREQLREAAEDHRPVLAVDVDGVISLFGFDEPLTEAPGEMHLIDGVAHCISRPAGERLKRLADHYDLIWATGWEERANEHLPLLLGLPGELPYLSFGGNARFGTAHWKLEALAEYAGDRPLAWVDDSLDDSCYDWAEEREAPTLLVRTESDIGITEAHTETLLGWVAAGYTAR